MAYAYASRACIATTGSASNRENQFNYDFTGLLDYMQYNGVPLVQCKHSVNSTARPCFKFL